MRWLRGFFSSGDPIIKLAGALSEPDALMRRELLEKNGIAALMKNMSGDSAAYGAASPFGFGLFVKQSDAERAAGILGPLMDASPDETTPGDGNGAGDGAAR